MESVVLQHSTRKIGPENRGDWLSFTSEPRLSLYAADDAPPKTTIFVISRKSTDELGLLAFMAAEQGRPAQISVQIVAEDL